MVRRANDVDGNMLNPTSNNLESGSSRIQMQQGHDPSDQTQLPRQEHWLLLTRHRLKANYLIYCVKYQNPTAKSIHKKQQDTKRHKNYSHYSITISQPYITT